MVGCDMTANLWRRGQGNKPVVVSSTAVCVSVSAREVAEACKKVCMRGYVGVYVCCKGLLGDKRVLRVKSECLIVRTRLGGNE